jgi:hypothetical protein
MINKEIVAQAIIEKVQNENVNANIRTNLMEGYGRPDEVFIKGNKRIGFTPDVLLKTDDSTEFYEIDLDQDFKLEKWKLFSIYLKKQGGTLNIVTPEKNLQLLRTFLNANKIDARILFFS